MSQRNIGSPVVPLRCYKFDGRRRYTKIINYLHNTGDIEERLNVKFKFVTNFKHLCILLQYMLIFWMISMMFQIFRFMWHTFRRH